MKIELKVDLHLSGNRTLKERSGGRLIWKDCTEPSALCVNADPAGFYTAVQQLIYAHIQNGAEIEFNDAEESPASHFGIEIHIKQP